MPYQFPTPYITPDIIKSAATGISWSTIPYRDASPAQQLAEQYNICQRATNMADTAAGQVLRATISTEQFVGPGSTRWRQEGILSVVLLARGPILSLQGGQIAPRTPPLQFTAIPAAMMYVNSPPLAIYGTSVPGDAGEFSQSITLSASGLWGGRGSAVLRITYTNGWPHCSLTEDASAGDTTISVDDCTGFAPPEEMDAGAAGIFYDPAGGQETGTAMTASVPAGPGTLTLARPLDNGHQAGVVFSAMPSQIHWGCILYGVGQALTRGATATTPQTIAPTGAKTSDGAQSLMKQGREMICAFRRMW